MVGDECTSCILGSYIIVYYFSGCGLGQQMVGDECTGCILGSFNDEQFHTKTECKNCTSMNFSLFDQV